jgi:hypothetical protein
MPLVRLLVLVLAGLLSTTPAAAYKTFAPTWLTLMNSTVRQLNSDVSGKGCYGVLIAPDIVLTSAWCRMPDNTTVSLVYGSPLAKPASVLASSIHPEFAFLENLRFLFHAPKYSVRVVLIDTLITRTPPAKLATSMSNAPRSMITLLPDMSSIGGRFFPRSVFVDYKDHQDCDYFGGICTTFACAPLFNITHLEEQWSTCQRVGTFLLGKELVYGLLDQGLYRDKMSVFTSIPQLVPWISATQQHLRKLRSAVVRREVCNAMFHHRPLILIDHTVDLNSIRVCANTTMPDAYDAVAYAPGIWYACRCGPIPTTQTAFQRKFGIPIQNFKFSWSKATHTVHRTSILGSPGNPPVCDCISFLSHVAAP